MELGSRRNGYPAFATKIARDPDDETFVYRRFNRLNARNLLYLQCQVLELEYELDAYDEAAGYKKSQLHWEDFAKNAEQPGSSESKLMELQGKIQEKLHEYNEALLLQSEISRLERPSSRVLSALRNWFTGAYLESGNGASFPIVGGKAEHLLDDENDLVALKTPPDQDPLSRTLRNHWRPLGKRQQGAADDGAEYYLERDLSRLVAVVSSVVAAVLLIGAVVALPFIPRAAARLGTIACCTILFALSLGLLTNAKRAEIFAATAAYAAVLVVFVSGDLGGSGNSQCACKA